jgi:hypothetical protein
VRVACPSHSFNPERASWTVPVREALAPPVGGLLGSPVGGRALRHPPRIMATRRMIESIDNCRNFTVPSFHFCRYFLQVLLLPEAVLTCREPLEKLFWTGRFFA